MNLYKLKPYCAKAIWGGENLRKKYGKISDENIAEAWELSGYPGKESVIVGGEYDGKTITSLVSSLGKHALAVRKLDVKAHTALGIDADGGDIFSGQKAFIQCAEGAAGVGEVGSICTVTCHHDHGICTLAALI